VRIVVADECPLPSPSMVDPLPQYRRFVPVVAAVIWTCMSLGAGCANDSQQRWENDVLEAQRLHDRGEWATAERRYRTLLDRADDTEDRRHVRLQLARLAADRGDIERALERYRDIWSEPRDDAPGARAMYEAARLTADRADRPEEARSMKRRLVERYPNSSWAELSVEDLADHYADRGDWEGLRSEMDALYESVRETAVADHVLQTAGEALWRDAHRPGAALPYFRRVIDEHPDGETVDDAEWAAGQIYVRRQDWENALAVLGRLGERVQSSWLVGTFNSPHASEARYELGRIQLLFLDDYDEAIDHFERYLSDFPRNRRADDSLWQIAQAHRLAGRPNACRRTLKRLIEEFPESRHVDSARDTLEVMK